MQQQRLQHFVSPPFVGSLFGCSKSMAFIFFSFIPISNALDFHSKWSNLNVFLVSHLCKRSTIKDKCARPCVFAVYNRWLPHSHRISLRLKQCDWKKIQCALLERGFHYHRFSRSYEHFKFLWLHETSLFECICERVFQQQQKSSMWTFNSECYDAPVSCYLWCCFVVVISISLSQHGNIIDGALCSHEDINTHTNERKTIHSTTTMKQVVKIIWRCLVFSGSNFISGLPHEYRWNARENRRLPQHPETRRMPESDDITCDPNIYGRISNREHTAHTQSTKRFNVRMAWTNGCSNSTTIFSK